MQFRYGAGVYLPACNLWLDPTASRSEAIISHGHADHVRRHATADATAATAALVLDRYSRSMRITAREFGVPFVRDGVRVTLYPAGHVLGSAQVLVDNGSRRLLYTGDLRLRPSPACEPAEVPSADVLILDATFGHPRYCFPPDDEVLASILRFCEQSFERGMTPVLLAYSLGKAQEVIAHLHRSGYPVAVHPTVEKMNAVYRRHGVMLPECSGLDAPLPPGTVIVAPPQARRGQAFAALGPIRTAVLTGWAMDSGARYRYGADAAIPLSDHCGYDDLLRYVELTGAREVYTVFGRAEPLLRELRLRGILAAPAGQPAQLAFQGFA